MSDLPSYPREAAEREAAVVPEAPAYDFASWGSRVGAYLLDALILVVPIVIAVVLVAVSNPDEDSNLWLLVVFVVFGLPFVYFTVMHGSERGQTYGKRAVGIRVIQQNGGRLGYGSAFARYAVTFLFGIFSLPLLLDYLWPLWDGRNQALHDKVSSSLVVRA